MYLRFVECRIREALEDTRVVLVCGPRQSGKTTLAQQMARDAIPFITLDDATTLRAASTDPVGFVRGFDRAVIDEVQREPELILAIKVAADADPRPRAVPAHRLRRFDDLAARRALAGGPYGHRPSASLGPGRIARRGSRLSRRGVRG